MVESSRSVRILVATVVVVVSLFASSATPAAAETSAAAFTYDGAGYYVDVQSVSSIVVRLTVPQLDCSDPRGLLDLGLTYLTDDSGRPNWKLSANLACSGDGISPGPQLLLYDYRQISRGYEPSPGDVVTMTYTARPRSAVITVRNVTTGDFIRDTVPVVPTARLFIGGYRDPSGSPGFASVKFDAKVDGRPLGALGPVVQQQLVNGVQQLHVRPIATTSSKFTLLPN